MKSNYNIKRLLVLCVCICALSLSCQVFAGSVQLVKNAHDKSQSRHLILKNGLRVILISDANFNSAAAALAVGIGSLADPVKHLGLAHFLEHMLFLGTKKYPEVSAYGSYLKDNGGYSNAYTAKDHTNFYFEVRPNAYEGALDRFSQFFIAPLFDSKYTQREMHAVNSEQQKNIQNDYWRINQVQRLYFSKNHPATKFGTGNLTTLKDVTPAILKSFYNKYYSANTMALVMLSPFSLDTMQEQAEKYFALIKNKHLKKWHCSKDFFEKQPYLRILKVKPIKDGRSITYTFALPGIDELYPTKTVELISACLGYEGAGSLLSYLKQKGYATGLSSGAYGEISDYAQFQVHIELTKLGLKNYQSVTKALFSYIAMLRQRGVSANLFEEHKRLAELSYTYDDKGEGGDRASMLSANILRYPLKDAENIDYIYRNFDKDKINYILSYLIPQLTLVTIVSRDVLTDKIEPIYGTEYSYEELDDEFYNSLLKPKLLKSLTMPLPNPFIPNKTTVLKQRPVKIEESKGWATWYAQDVTFQRPKALSVFSFRLPKDIIPTKREAALQKLYALIMEEQVNEISYPAHEVDLKYSISTHQNAITLRLEGFTDSLPKLQKILLQNMTHITVNNQTFNAIKERIKRAGNSFKLSSAWKIGREYSRAFRKKYYFLPDELAQEIENISLSDLKNFTKHLFDKGFLRCFIYGNLTSDEARSWAQMARRNLLGANWQPIDYAQCRRSAVIDANSITQKLNFVHQLPGNNSCLWRSYFLGNGTAKLRATALLIGAIIKQPFYTQMRTKQQLGYIVFSATPEDENNYYLFLILQSAEYAPDYLAKAVDGFLSNLSNIISLMPDNQLQQLKSGIIHSLEKSPKSIVEKGVNIYGLTFNRQGYFQRDLDTIKALRKITKLDVLSLLQKQVLNPSQSRLDLMLFAKQHKISNTLKSNIKNPFVFKQNVKFAPAKYPSHH